MEKIDCKSLSNSELKLHIETLRHSFEAKKNELMRICTEMGNIEKQYNAAQHELEIRKNIYL
jgi:hypothetical protein